MAIFSPRSPSYDRLESGHGPARGKKKGLFDWKKFGIAAFVLIGLVYLFGPRETRVSWGSVKEEGTDVGLPNDPFDDAILDSPGPTDPIPHHGTDTPLPTSFETDPNPSSTQHCTTHPDPSSSSSSPLVQYALIIDAGSTGSRIHVYKFNNCKPGSLTYEYETFKMTKPGLSSYAGRPEDAAKSLDVLMDEAVRVVPEEMRGCSVIAVKATAGLRLLKSGQGAEILVAVRERLEKVYPFKVVDGDRGVEIMDGKDEGVYAWITANYLLGTIKAGSGSSSSSSSTSGGKKLLDQPTTGTTSYAVLDLGGASTQIVFEPYYDARENTRMEEGEHKYDLKFGGKDYVLYQHSYLGYGLMRARRSVHQLVEFMDTLRGSDSFASDRTIANPCLAVGTTRKVEITDDRTGEKRTVTMSGSDIGSFDACMKIMQLVMAKDSICEVKPCSFNGVYQPSLLSTFQSGKVLLLSYFYDRIYPLLHPPSASLLKSDPNAKDTAKLSITNLSALARNVCAGPASWAKAFKHLDDKESANEDGETLRVELEGRPEWCLDLTFMYALLRLGYEFEEGREVVIGKRIGGTELGWSLGAGIGEVGGEVRCRV